MIELRHGICAYLFDRCVKISLRKAVRLGIRHFVFFGALIVRFVHSLHDAVKYFLLARIVLVQSAFGDAELFCDVAH